MSDYRVKLDIYDGPLDLLLYLIRREELDIYDIPIARITEQYLGYVELLKKLDPNIAGEFMVVAATLLEIKTRMLLPPQPAAEGDEEAVLLDPRAELIRRLLEYKAFKDAAGDLRDAADKQTLRFPRIPVEDEQKETFIDLEDAQVWDLLDAFSKLMESIGQGPTEREIVYDETPIELHATDIIDRLRRDGGLTFGRIFEGRTLRSEIVGLFLALLELIRQKKIIARQRKNFDDIFVEPNPSADVAGEPQAGEAPDSDGALNLGEYTSHSSPPPSQEHDNDSGTETQEPVA